MKIFRKFRVEFLIKSSFSRYFFYAIGEILLVMIGILLALQVNNWNEQRKSRKLQISTLEELKDGFLLDIENLREDSIRNEETVRYIDSLISCAMAMSWEERCNCLLGKPMVKSYIGISRAAYEMLKSRGVDLISNDRLRVSLIDYFEQELDYYEEVQDSFKEDDQLFKEYYLNFVYEDRNSSFTHCNFRLYDPHRVLNNSELIGRLKEMRSVKYRELNMMSNFLEFSQSMSADIQSEIEHLGPKGL